MDNRVDSIIFDLDGTLWNTKGSGIIIYSGVIDTLRKLSLDYKLFIVSNCADGYIESFLDCHGLSDLFTDYIPTGKYDISKSKAIKDLIFKYNLKRPIYIGDTYGDFNHAKDAGITFIHARYGYCPLLESNFYIDAIDDIFSVLDDINNN